MRSHVALRPLLAARHGLRALSGPPPSFPLIFARHFFVPSPEQLAVIQHCEAHNVMVSARPGAGKTATAQALVQANQDAPIAVVTYSKRLQLETQQRLAEYPLADAFTFHGLATRLFGEMVNNDTILRSLRKRKALPVWNMPEYRFVVLDELQDMTSDLFWLSCAFISALTARSGRHPNLLILGDQRQAIYEFRGADARYLTLSPTTFSPLSPYPWQNLKLAQSFRLSHQTAKFVNNAFLSGEEYVQGSHNGPRPIYVNAHLDQPYTLIDLFLPLIRQYGPENTAILAPFVRTNPFLPELTNTLSKRYSIPIAVSTSDDISLDADVLNGKLAVSTYHQFKGSERDCVIVYGADASYFTFMARDLPDDRCPNATFVALTRARKQLVVVQNYKDAAMPFVDWDAVRTHADYINLAMYLPRVQYAPGRPLRLGLLLPMNVLASECARHVRDEELDDLLRANVRIVELVGPTPRGDFDSVPDKVCTDAVKGHYEAISDLNGLAVTAALEWSLQGKLHSFGYGKGRGGKRMLPPVPKNPRERAVWLLREAAQYEAKVSHYRSRLVQMRHHAFDWFAVEDGRLLDLAVTRLRNELLSGSVTIDSLTFEHTMQTQVKIDEEETKLIGRADILFSDTRGQEVHTTIWEVKFVSSLSQEHVAQAVVYAYLWWTTSQPKSRSKRKAAPVVHFPRIVLFNVRTGAKWEVQTTAERARALIEGVLRAKYTSKGESSFEEFVADCMKVVKAVESSSSRIHEKKQ
ncbi:P-loop containing nucleoside triphosphate hydrolase protein [Auricularia subglabra TFB-10046 SS5]|nr:P-loop containing nucleoside triphosphate hydrolase protein [Auricularia subglabra TFB-10046 SS5]